MSAAAPSAGLTGGLRQRSAGVRERYGSMELRVERCRGGQTARPSASTLYSRKIGTKAA